MADPLPKYRAIPAGSNHHNHVSRSWDDLHPGTEWTLAIARTEWTYFMLGCAIFLPWNALACGTPFFLSRLAGSSFYPSFGPYLFSVYSISKLVCQFYCAITSKQSAPSRRKVVSIAFAILFMTLLCLSTYMRGTPLTFFLFALLNAAALALSIGYLCTATYAVASLLGPSVLQSMLSGQSAIGVVVSAVQLVSSIVSLWGLSPKSNTREARTTDGTDDAAGDVAARIFFGVSAIFLAITLVAYAMLARQPFYRSASRSLEQCYGSEDADELTGLATDGCRSTQTHASWHVYQIFQQNFIFMFCIMYVFAITVAVFPAITVYVQSVNPDIHPLLFTAIHIMVFNIGDLAGRYACSFPRLLVWSAKWILAMSLLRTLFIPLLFLCNIRRTGTTIPTSPIINSDAPFMIILLTMGCTNGYVSALATLAVSSIEHNPGLKGRREDVDVAATLAGFFMIVGLTIGALCSFGVQAMI